MSEFIVTGPDGKKYRVKGDSAEGAAQAVEAFIAGNVPQREKIGHTGGLSANIVQGALFGFGDEYLAGLSAVAGLQPDGNGGASWFNYDKPFSERYDDALGVVRSEFEQYSEENPGKALTAQIIGGAGTAVAGGSALGLKAAQTGVGRLAQVAGGGAAAGAVEGFGSGEGGLSNRAKNAGIGGAVGLVFAPLVGFGLAKIAGAAQRVGGKALRSIFTNRQMFDPKTGTLTASGVEKMRQLGFDPKSVSDEMRRSFGELADRATGRLDDATIARTAQADRFGVPLTRGQATGDVIQSAQEEAFRAGARGRPAEQTMSGFDAMQRAAVADARDATGRRIGAEAVDRIDASDAVISGVRREAETARQAGRAAYDAVEDMGAGLSASAVSGLPSRLQRAVEMSGHRITPETVNASSAMNYLSNVFADASDGAVPFTALERARSTLLRMQRAADSGNVAADQLAMREMVDAFDGFVDDAMTTALMQGDDAALPAVKEARALWSKYRNTFLSKQGADRFIQKIVQDDVSPDQVAGWLFGANKLGGGQTSLVARRIRDVLGKDSPEWGMVKRAAWEQMTNGAQDMGPQRVASNLSDFLDGKGKTLARELYSPAELQQIREFCDMLKILVPPRRATNPSGSGYEIQRGFAQVMGMLAGTSAGPIGTIAGREAVSASTDFTSNLAARAAAKGIPINPSSNAIAIGGGVSAGAAAQERTVR